MCSFPARVVAAFLVVVLLGSSAPSAARVSEASTAIDTSMPPVPGDHEGVPRRARQYYRRLVGESRRIWGLNAPISLLAGQIHQESAWRPDAHSRYAGGLAQFTRGTADWMGDLYPNDLGNVEPYNPKWAIRALAKYDHWLYRRITPRFANEIPDCDRWAMTLSAYNGGLGWLNGTRKVAGDRELTAKAGGSPDLWWGQVENHTGRADWARKENREYPRKILRRWAPLYHSAGWGGEAVCRP